MQNLLWVIHTPDIALRLYVPDGISVPTTYVTFDNEYDDLDWDWVEIRSDCSGFEYLSIKDFNEAASSKFFTCFSNSSHLFVIDDLILEHALILTAM